MNINKRKQTGSGLIEAMISIFVVSIGFLGFAGVQVTGLAAANDSLYRSKAIYLSYQMADRVRANLPGAQAGAYNSFSGDGYQPRLHQHRLHRGAACAERLLRVEHRGRRSVALRTEHDLQDQLGVGVRRRRQQLRDYSDVVRKRRLAQLRPDVQAMSVRRQQGMGLVELLVWMAVSLLIISVIGVVYANTKQLTRVNDNVSRLQENGRFVVYLLNHDSAWPDFAAATATTRR